MGRRVSKIHEKWWDYTTLDTELLEDAAKLTLKDLEQLSRPGFKVTMYDSREEFFLAEAMEYIEAWKQATPGKPAGVCGPIGPTEQLPLVAQLVNALGIDLRNAHFWGMDEWYDNQTQKEVEPTHPLSFEKADRELCFNRIDRKLRMPDENIHFPKTRALEEYTKSFDAFSCIIMQGGQGEIKHWAFNDPVKREGPYKDAPPSPEEFKKYQARVVELHPLTLIQNARTSFNGQVSGIPTHALTVGPKETFKCRTISIWHPGWHDTPFGVRLTTLMISKRFVDSSVPMSVLADHPDVRFNIFRKGVGEMSQEIH